MPTPNRLFTSVARHLRAMFLLAAAAVTAAALQAQATGTLTGRVTDSATALALAGTRVTVQGTGLETYTGPSGDYVLTGVPAGARTVEFGYIGYGEKTQAVEVAAGATTRADVAFSAGALELDKFVITGSLVGTARAINQQRGAASLTSIVASDEIGRFPDQNAAESLQRLPGVSLYRDQGEGRFINLRGLNYIYTGVTLNGSSLASPELGDRAIALDLVPSDSLASLEVTKVPTPDMDAEGLGGTVNIRTKSAFDSTGRDVNVSAQTLYTRLTEEFGFKGNATFSDILMGGKLGVLGAVTWQERNFGSHNFEEDGYSLRSAGTGGPSFFALNNLAFRDYVITRERYGASGAVEFRPDSLTKFYVNGAYNRFTDTEDRHLLNLPFERGTVSAISANSLTVAGLSRPRRDIRIREKDQELRALSAGFEKQAGPWTFDAKAAWSEGIERRPGELTVRLRRNTADTGLRYTFNSLYDVTVEQTAGASITDPANYTTVDRIQLNVEKGTDTEGSLAFNARYDLENSSRAYVKAGAVIRSKEKESRVDSTRFAAPATFTFATLAGPQNPDYPYGFKLPRINHDAVLRDFYGNFSAFTPTVQVADSLLEDWTSTEDILAGYVMTGATWGKTNVMAGVRLERTDFESRGNELRGAVITPTTASRDYDHVLPGVHVRHDFSKNLVGRLSYSGAIRRPSFAESAIFRNVDDAGTTVTAGNPNLKALEAASWDASIEYYLPALGVVSAAVFHKDIENFSYAYTVLGGDPAFPTYNLVTFANGSDGQVSGLELAYQQQLRMLPAPFDGLGFMANLTLADSSAEYPTRPGEELAFIGQSDLTGNLALTYEKNRFFARLALNWRDAHLREDEPIGANTDEDRYIDDFYQLDLSASYRFQKNWEVYGEVINLTNQPFRVYFNSSNGQGRRFVQFEEYDVTVNLGVRWKL
jgi:TonB-dependent receptor